MAEFLELKLSETKDFPNFYNKLLEALSENIQRGGKWIRPLLTRIAYHLVESKTTIDKTLLLKLSVIMELNHRFLLIHDDLIDNDLERHGGKTIEKIYQEHSMAFFNQQEDHYARGMAIVGGDIVHTWTFAMVEQSGVKPQLGLRLIAGLNQCIEETAAGWTLETELKYLPFDKVTKDQVWQAMELVSGRYSVVWPLRMGQLIAGKTNYSRALEEFGLHAGLAFQLQDDLLALIGKPKVTGKPIANDLREGKKSIPLLLAYERTTKEGRSFMESQLRQPTTQTAIEKIQAILNETMAIESTRKMASTHSAKAMKALEKINQSEAKDQLMQIGEFLALRDH